MFIYLFFFWGVKEMPSFILSVTSGLGKQYLEKRKRVLVRKKYLDLRLAEVARDMNP
jgi:hypothetical protein